MQRQKELTEKPSKQFQEAWQIIHGTQYQDDGVHDQTESIPLLNNIQISYEQAFKSEKLELEERIRIKKKLIAEKDNEISSLKIEMAGENLCCILGLLMEVNGAVSIGSGISDMGNDHPILGLIEIAGGVASMHVGDQQIDQSTRAVEALSIKESRLNLERLRLKQELTDNQKDLYQLEKNETLRILNEQTKPESILRQAATQQFDAIDADIQQGKFSKAYVDVAINTKKILTAPNKKLRNEYADKHLAIGTKASVSKAVGGCMLLFLGVAIALTSVVLAVIFIKTGPLAILGGLAGVATGIGFGACGIEMLKSGLPRNKTPWVTQSLFKVAKAVKEEPEPARQASCEHINFKM